MAWLGTTAPFLVLLATIYLPGAVLVAVFARRIWVIVGLAPLISAGVLGIAALATGSGRVEWGFRPLIAVVGILLVLALAARQMLVARGRLRSGQRYTLRLDRMSIIAIACALLINGIVVVCQYIKPVNGPESVIQLYDTPFHFSVIRWILDSGDASPLHSAAVDGATSGSTFYPSLWHAWVALGYSSAGGSLALAVNASLLVVLTTVWPIGVAVLTRTVLGPGRQRAVVVSLGVAGLFSVFPWLFLSFGVLYSNLFSYALAPEFIALILLLLRSRAGTKEHWLPSAAGVALGFVAFALAQPNTLFTVAVLTYPYLCVRLTEAVPARVRYRRAIQGLVVVLFSGAVAAMWKTVHDLPFMARTVTWQWPAFDTPWGAIRSVIDLGMNQSPPQPLLAALVLVGLATLLFSRCRWIIVSYLLMATLYVLASSTSGWFRDLATGFWYHDSTRLSAALVIVLVPILAVGIDTTVSLVTPKRFHGETRLLFVTLCVVSVVAAVTLTGQALGLRRTSLSIDSDGSTQRFVDSGELAFMEQVRQAVGPDAVIANNPYDGSAFGYSMLNIDVLFRSFPGNWISPLGSDYSSVMSGLSDLGDNPTVVCPAVERLGVGYVLHLGNNQKTLNYDPDSWKGIDDVVGTTDGFQVVLKDGNMVLYKIVGC